MTWPHLRPVTVFTTIWQTVTALQLFDLIYTTTRGGPLNSTQTVVYFVYELARQVEPGRCQGRRIRAHRFVEAAGNAFHLFARGEPIPRDFAV